MSIVETASLATVDLTAADLVEKFGPISLRRIVLDPRPGDATEEDLIEHLRRTGRACELVDGILVEKDVSWDESTIAAELIRLIGNFVRERRLGGKVAGEQGMVNLPVGRVRAPDVAYVSRARLGVGRRPPIPSLVPELVVEVLSPSNTPREMDEKLDDYFESGVELVWYVDGRSRTVRAYTARDAAVTLTEAELLEGGKVLPGFSVKVGDLFSESPE